MLKTYNQNIERLIEYIGNNYDECLYLYLNLIKYGFSNPNIKVWIEEENDSISCIVLKYYTGMHVFSKDKNLNIEDVIDLIIKEQPTIICSEKRIIEELMPYLKTDYNSEIGWVRCMNKKYECNNEEVQIAKEKDLYECSELIMKDEDMSSSYTLDELYKQIKVRNVEKYGRNYMIKDNDKIIAHASTGAESEKVGVLTHVMVDFDYRGKGYATKVCSKLCNDLIDEGKSIYLINYTNESTRLYDKLGFTISCEFGKLYRK